MFYRSDAEAPRYWVFQQIFNFRFPPENSPTDIGLIECVDQPDTGPELHTHVSEETFYVLEGTVQFSYWDESEQKLVSFEGGPGAVAHIDSGVPHGYKNVGEAPSRLVAVLTDASNIVSFFMKFAVEGKESDPLPEPPTPEQLSDFLQQAEEHGIFPFTVPET